MKTWLKSISKAMRDPVWSKYEYFSSLPAPAIFVDDVAAHMSMHALNSVGEGRAQG